VTASPPGRRRQIAVWTHDSRPAALSAAGRFIEAMAAHGVDCLVRPEALAALAGRVGGAGPRAADSPLPPAVELVVVFGGDGSILRGAQWALAADIPLLGVNLGHVGFLAELEVSQLDQLADRVAGHEYASERRLTLASAVFPPGADEPAWQGLAVNEAALEKASRQSMIEVMAAVDGLPVSRWSCDGVLVSTPTGSTAYAFSAGGPIMWPDLEAFLLVPMSAHALFNRAMVLAPGSAVCLDLLTPVPAVLSLDGARGVDVAPGSRVEVRRGAHDLTMARLAVQPFTSRLVKKFALPVDGFPGRQGMTAPC
jgi:NAD+ kinase